MSAARADPVNAVAAAKARKAFFMVPPNGLSDKNNLGNHTRISLNNCIWDDTLFHKRLKGYDWIRELAREQGAWANIPPKQIAKTRSASARISSRTDSLSRQWAAYPANSRKLLADAEYCEKLATANWLSISQRVTLADQAS
jgi:hypothetical protein